MKQLNNWFVRAFNTKQAAIHVKKVAQALRLHVQELPQRTLINAAEAIPPGSWDSEIAIWLIIAPVSESPYTLYVEHLVGVCTSQLSILCDQ